MRVLVQQKDLAKTAQQMSAALGDGKSIPALGAIKIEATDAIRMFATDLITSLQAVIVESIIKAPGSFCVPGKLFIDTIASLPPGEVELNLSGNKLVIKQARSMFGINVMPSDDFPLAPNVVGQLSKVNSKHLKDTIQKVIYAAHTDATRPALCGVCIAPDGVYATDGYRLALVQNHNLPIGHSVVIPANHLKGLLGQFPDDEDMGVMFGEREVHFSFLNRVASVRLIEERYPDVLSVIPYHAHEEATFNRLDLIKSIRRASLLASTLTKGVSLEFKPGKLEIGAKGEHGQSVEELEGTCISNEKIFFASPFLLQSLERLSENTVTLELRGSRKPIVIKEGNYVNVIMPRSE